jgi:hypothetical protein
MIQERDPINPIIDTDYTGDFPVSFVSHFGLTKREWFAGLAMQAIISAGGLPTLQAIAEESAKIATCMINELNKPQEAAQDAP